LKIAVISYRPIGPMPTGSRRIIIDLAVGLKEKGFHVDIYNISRRGYGCPDDISLEGVGCVELSEDLLRRSLLLLPRILTLASNEALLFIKLAAQSMVDRISKVYQELAEAIDSKGYDLAILETIYLSHLGSLLRSRGIQAVLRLHNVEAEYIASLSYSYLKDIAYRSMKVVERRSLITISNRVVISMRDKEIIKRLYGLETQYLGPTVRGSRRDCSPRDQELIKGLGLECGSYALFVGSPHKPNADALYNILNGIYKGGVGIDLAVVGGIGKYMEGRISDKRVKILGIVPDRILRSLYCCASFSLAPIVSGGGVPIKLIESILYGVPTVTSKRAELIIPGLKHLENVVIIERIGGIAEALKILSRDRILRNKISEGAQRIADELIGFERTIERYRAYIEDIANQ